MSGSISVVRVAAIVALGGFLMGFDASVISGVVGFIEPEFALTKIELGWAVASLTLTATLGMMASGPVSDRIGRRSTLAIAALIFLVSALASAVAPNYLVLVIARMLGGFGVGAALIVAPIYISEMAPPESRGKLVSINQLNIVLGISAAFFSNWFILQLAQGDAGWATALGIAGNPWRWMLGVEALPALAYLLALAAVPESPRWLVMRGQHDDATAVLTRLRGAAAAEREMVSIREHIAVADAETGPQLGLRALFETPMRLILVIGLTIAIMQQITGINAVFFYAPMIFEQAGVGRDAAFAQAVLVGLVNIVFTVLAMALIDRLGRRTLLLIGSTGVCLSLFVLAWGFDAATYTLPRAAVDGLGPELAGALEPLVGRSFDSDLAFREALGGVLAADQLEAHSGAITAAAISVSPTLILGGILGFVASFAISLGPVMWVLLSEIVPNRLRGAAVSFLGFVNSAVSFLVQLVFPWELETLGSATTFLAYGCFGLVGLAILAWCLPETRGRSLEELEELLVKAPAARGT